MKILINKIYCLKKLFFKIKINFFVKQKKKNKNYFYIKN